MCHSEVLGGFKFLLQRLNKNNCFQILFVLYFYSTLYPLPPSLQYLINFRLAVWIKLPAFILNVLRVVLCFMFLFMQYYFRVLSVSPFKICVQLRDTEPPLITANISKHAPCPCPGTLAIQETR